MKKTKKNSPKRTRCEIFSRIVGYLRPVSQWNEGKAAEYKMRKEYSAKNL